MQAFSLGRVNQCKNVKTEHIHTIYRKNSRGDKRAVGKKSTQNRVGANLLLGASLTELGAKDESRRPTGINPEGNELP